MPALPSVLNREAWRTPAGQGDYAAAASHLMSLCEPDASDQRQQVMTRLLASYDYTRAELLLAMREVPRDPEAGHNYGRGFSVADLHRIVADHRQARQQLDRPVTAPTRDELCAQFDELRPQDFPCCSYNKFNEPLFRYNPDL